MSLRGAQRRGNLTQGIATAPPRDDSEDKDSFSDSKTTLLSALSSPLSAPDVPSLIGAAIMIRRSLFRELSGFDEQFFFFLEETDLCVRARQQSTPNTDNRSSIIDHRTRVVFLPDVKVIHLQGKTVGKNWIKGRIEYNISLYKFIRKHHSALYYRSFQAVRFTKSIITILVLSLLPFLLIGKGTRRSYRYYRTLFLWHLSGCPDTAGIKGLAIS